MTRKEALRQTAQQNALASLGVSYADADSLRRISMTLTRWHEGECGDGNGGIERDGDEPDSKPYRVYWSNFSPVAKRYPIPDRETGALKRLAKIMAKYPNLTPYVQGDPRGCALYILRPDDVPVGADVSSYYSRGIAVY
jgi:hypothetical protein